MGGGSWTSHSFETYSTSKGRSVDPTGYLRIKDMNASQVYTQTSIADSLNPKGVIRECRDSIEHPNTVPVILALDVTGSMGQTAVEVASELNIIMTELYNSVKDVEFMIMGIGDFTFDDEPLQVSQFESDIRIAEQLDKLYFEFGGGPNAWESYSASWAFAATQTELDCLKRGKKGIIITLGDEELNPSIQAKTEYNLQVFSKDISTSTIYEMVSKKYDVYHINVKHGLRNPDLNRWKSIIGDMNVYTCEVKSVSQVITDIVKNHEIGMIETDDNVADNPVSMKQEYISW